MIKFVLTTALVLAAGSTVAEQIDPSRIIAGATGDWDHDGQQDLALLVGPPEPNDDIGIYIYLRDKNHSLLKLVIAAPGKIWGNSRLDGLFGQDPSIEALASGSISVHTENSGIGRDRWNQTLTLAYRGGQFVVAGYTFGHYDTLDNDDTGECDYNVLTGAISISGKTSKVDPRTVSLSDWNDDIGQHACGQKND